MELTPLEQALVDATAARHWPSFRIDALRVTTRDHTGVGRFTHLEDLQHQTLPAGSEGRVSPSEARVSPGGDPAGGRSVGSRSSKKRSYHSAELIIAMDGVPHGMGWVIWVEEGRIDHIEIFTYGSAWDGTERSWRLVPEGIDLDSI